MTKPDDREAILYAFAVEPNHDSDTLGRYLQQHPELAEELIDLSSEFRLGEALGPNPADATLDNGWEAAWQELVGSRPKAVGSSEGESLFARFRGEAFVRLAEALNVPRSFLLAFRDGLVIASSIPQRFAQRFARVTDSPLENVLDCFAAHRPLQVARDFKADTKPSHQGQITFRDLVETTEMTDEQRQLLRDDCNNDGLD